MVSTFGVLAICGLLAGVVMTRIQPIQPYARAVLGVSAVTILVVAIIGAISQRQTNSAGFRSGLTSSSSPDASCRADLQCWGDKHSIRATSKCRAAIELLAKYKHEWTDGLFESKLSRFRWADQQYGHIEYIGDRINFQNGFGAWVPHTYTCVYNPQNESLVEVTAVPGRIR